MERRMGQRVVLEPSADSSCIDPNMRKEWKDGGVQGIPSLPRPSYRRPREMPGARQPWLCAARQPRERPS